MLRMTLHMGYDRRLAIVLLCVLAGIVLAVAASALIPPARAETAISVTYEARGPGRHFYVTSANYATNQVLAACAADYHMASLWEILDVSNLTYDYDHPAAKKQADSGYGPPSNWNGWVRTGYSSSGSATTGTGNCLNWTSTSSANNGVSVRLPNAWETAPGDIAVWDATSFACTYSGPVWCVRNVYTVYAPVIIAP